MWFGGVARGGQQGVLLPLPDRARASPRSGCAASSTRSSRVLKAVFLAVEDFKDMGRVVPRAGPALRSKPRRRRPSSRPPRAFLDWLLDDNYIFMGTVRYRVGPDGQLDRARRDRDRRLHRPDAPARGLPGRRWSRSSPHLVPDAERPAHPRHRLLQQRAARSTTLEPIDDIVGPGVGRGRQARRARRVLARPLRARAPSPSAPTGSRSSRRSTTGSCARAGRSRSSHACREIRAAFNRFPKTRALLRQRRRPRSASSTRIVYMTGDDEIAVDMPPRARATRRSTSPSRACATPTRSRRRCAGRSPTRSGPSPSPPRSTAGAVTLLLFYFDSHALEHPVDRDEVAPADRAARHHLGGPRGRGPRGRVRRARGAAPLPALRHARRSRSGLYREVDAARAGARPTSGTSRPRGPARGRASCRAARGARSRCKLYSVRVARPHRHPAHPAEPRAHGHRGAAHPAHAARGPPAFLYRFEIEAPAGADRRAAPGRGALRRRAARARRGARHRRPAERPDPARPA